MPAFPTYDFTNSNFVDKTVVVPRVASTSKVTVWTNNVVATTFKETYCTTHTVIFELYEVNADDTLGNMVPAGNSFIEVNA